MILPYLKKLKQINVMKIYNVNVSNMLTRQVCDLDIINESIYDKNTNRMILHALWHEQPFKFIRTSLAFGFEVYPWLDTSSRSDHYNLIVFAFLACFFPKKLVVWYVFEQISNFREQVFHNFFQSYRLHRPLWTFPTFGEVLYLYINALVNTTRWGSTCVFVGKAPYLKWEWEIYNIWHSPVILTIVIMIKYMGEL